MSSNSLPIEFLITNAWRLPLFLVYIVGIVLALTTWRRHPRASLLSLIAFLLVFLSNALSAALNWYVLFMASDMSMGRRGVLMGAGNIVLTAIIVLAWILILFALFARRPQQSAQPIEPERYHPQHSEPKAPPGPASQDIRM